MLGIRPVICSIFHFVYYYTRYAPQGIIFPNTMHNLTRFAQGSSIFVVPSESGNGNLIQIKDMHGGTGYNPIYPECVDRFFCWGNSMKEVLEKSGKWKASQLAVTGGPATDHWMLPWPAAGNLNRRLGITTSLRVLSNSTSTAKTNYFRWIDEMELLGGDGIYYYPPEHAESWILFEASLIRVVLGIVRTAIVTRKEIVEIRPHPFERISRYDYFKDTFKEKVRINKAGTISEWLADKFILFTYLSASALDAAVKGIPVVSLKGLMDPDALRKVPPRFHYDYYDFFWQLKDFSQVSEFIDLAKQGRLAPCKDKKKLEEFLAEHFSFPRPAPAAALIAQEINAVLEEGGRIKKRFGSVNFNQRGILGHRYVLNIAHHLLVPPVLWLIAFIKYLYDLLPRRPDLRLTWQPWRLRELKQAKGYSLKVYALYKR
jgi:surface carbohydrate biosynthesis protein